MWMAAFFLLIIALCLIPARLQADVQRAGQTVARVRFSAAGLRREWHFAIVRTPQGLQLLAASRTGEPHPVEPESLRGGPFDRLMQSFFACPDARHYLLRHIRPERLCGVLRLHTGDAARTALLTGFLRSLMQLIPVLWHMEPDIRIVPDFLHARSELQARCIFRFRPGTIIITLALLFLSRFTQRSGKPREAA